MAAMRGPRLQAGSAQWIAEERAAALQIVQSEVEEFSYSARNELDWLNEHMAGIFNENEVNFAEAFKTPGKLRGKTPRTARKLNPMESRVPLSEVFSATPNALSTPLHLGPSPNTKAARGSPSQLRPAPALRSIASPKPSTQPSGTQDSGYFGSQDLGSMNIHVDADAAAAVSPRRAPPNRAVDLFRQSPAQPAVGDSTEKTFEAAKEEQTTQISAVASGVSKKQVTVAPPEVTSAPIDDEDDERLGSSSPSPVRPVVRKSSLNFASLPAREPLAAGKSTGTRTSRTSHLDQMRTSYYNRPTGGKSLGNVPKNGSNDSDDDMDLNEDSSASKAVAATSNDDATLSHNKTYTQRLQDQISMLGKSQSKPAAPAYTPAPKNTYSNRKDTLQSTPGAFPEDDDDDWIDPPGTATALTEERPGLPKSHTADVMEAIQGKETIGQSEFVHAEVSESPEATRQRQKPTGFLGHAKSASVPALPKEFCNENDDEISPLKKVVSVSNPAKLTRAETESIQSPSKSPARSARESPLKQVKNKLSSILKSSRGLLASSAALSAEGKSLMSPSSTRLGFAATMSSESLATNLRAEATKSQSTLVPAEGSPSRPAARRTRASAEKEEKKREKETKRLDEQNDKLEKARQKEREKSRVYAKEQERIAAMEEQIVSKKDEATLPKEAPRQTRVSPRRAKPEEGVEKDIDMDDAPSAAPTPSIPRSLGPAHATRNGGIKRPVKPAAKPKQAPTVIRVNTGSQHSQYRLSAAPAEANISSASQPSQTLASKASKASLHTKTSTQSLRHAASTGRTKAQELAAKKKEQEERETTKRREEKAEQDKKRLAAQEEQRKNEIQRRQEAERQKQMQQQEQTPSQTQGKNSAQRKAALEKAKQTKAPPPAVRTQPNGPPDITAHGSQPPRPASRMVSNAHWQQDDGGRPVNAVLSNGGKSGSKRPLPQGKPDDGQSKPQPARPGQGYQANEAKRRRTSEVADAERESANTSNIKGPPLRPSAAYKRDLTSKSVFQNGYAAAPQTVTRDLFKASVTSQQAGSGKPTHPLGMAQISKGGIPFGPNTNSSEAQHKTPARPQAAQQAKSAAKPALRSSPRFQNGEAIELPEIQTDDESDEEEAQNMTAPAWADPRQIQEALALQESMDPLQIFGAPGPLNMEEIFKNKERFHKFRARTSSANWSGADRLTEDDIRKDMAARDKLRRDGGWSYEMGRELV